MQYWGIWRHSAARYGGRRPTVSTTTRGRSVRDGIATPWKSARGAPGAAIDVTEPGVPLGEGRRHILTRTVAEIAERIGHSKRQLERHFQTALGTSPQAARSRNGSAPDSPSAVTVRVAVPAKARRPEASTTRR